MKSLVAEINWAIGLTLLLVAVVFGVSYYPYQMKERERLIGYRLFFVQSFKKSEERALIDNIFESKTEALGLELERLGHTEGIRALAVYDTAGHLLSDYPRSSLSGDLNPAEREQMLKNADGLHQAAEWKGGEDVLFFKAPFRAAGETIGYLQIVYSIEDVEEFQQASFIYLCLMLAALLLTSMVLLNRLMTRLVTRPVKRLVSTLEEVERGNLAARAGKTRPDEIGQLHQSFNAMVAKLQGSFTAIEKQNVELRELDRLKNEFLANVSHEIRTPLHAIIGFSEGLADEAKEPDQKKYLRMILDSGRTLQTLVSRLLNFSQIKSGKMILQNETFSIRKVIEAVIPIVQNLMGEKRLELVDRIPDDFPLVHGDPHCVQQVFLNLLENAVKFTEQGKITMEGVLRNGMLQFTVSDTGIGIPREQIGVIFEEFRQGDGSTRRRFGGTGLGLAIVKQLVQLHGGRIWVESVTGEGSSFHFTLPVSQGEGSL